MNKLAPIRTKNPKPARKGKPIKTGQVKSVVMYRYQIGREKSFCWRSDDEDYFFDGQLLMTKSEAIENREYFASAYEIEIEKVKIVPVIIKEMS